MKKSDWIMQNVFTDKNIDMMLKAEETYNVSMIFAIAVSVAESNLGTAGTTLCSPPAVVRA